MFEHHSKREVVSPLFVLGVVIAVLIVGAVTIGINFRGGAPWAFSVPSNNGIVHAATK